MKKLVMIAALVAASTMAMGAEVGIRMGQSGGNSLESNQAGLTTTGVTLGTKFGDFGAELAYDRSMVKSTSVVEYSLTGSYSVVKFGALDVLGKAGVSYIDPTIGSNGYALAVGVGVSYPLTKSVSWVADYSYKVGQERVSQFNGNQVSTGIKYSF